MFNFLKQIFTWWHKQTLGTFIYTLFTGKLAGIDEFGNKSEFIEITIAGVRESHPHEVRIVKEAPNYSASDS